MEFTPARTIVIGNRIIAQPPRKSYTVAETKKLLMAHLKATFPGIAFRVTTNKSFSLRVEWLDGPTFAQVQAICKQYEGTTFDPMIDLASPQHYLGDDGIEIHYGTRYVSPSRHLSRAFLEWGAATIAKDYGCPLLPVLGDRPGFYYFDRQNGIRIGSNANDRWVDDVILDLINSTPGIPASLPAARWGED